MEIYTTNVTKTEKKCLMCQSLAVLFIHPMCRGCCSQFKSLDPNQACSTFPACDSLLPIPTVWVHLLLWRQKAPKYKNRKRLEIVFWRSQIVTVWWENQLCHLYIMSSKSWCLEKKIKIHLSDKIHGCMSALHHHTITFDIFDSKSQCSRRAAWWLLSCFSFLKSCTQINAKAQKHK